jgi:thioredoxin-like negative regulator of GroEL
VQEPHYIRAAEASPDITFVAIDIDDNDWAVNYFGIKGVPFAFVYENGTQIRSLKVPQAAIPLLADIKG